ncbi:hypothetical protein BJ875DRAFT_495475 [Amylocarpus encephaloides]|uniref:F-box domain-containing protein n=1 Tax=Amylocarpus encephaloides TaxID=45428 RepID=A0A9P8C649_9HELO|nr:hypothetical protein BJ875DRAFT_495475 [Amylocarpus encephaloides]
MGISMEHSMSDIAHEKDTRGGSSAQILLSNSSSNASFVLQLPFEVLNQIFDLALTSYELRDHSKSHSTLTNPAWSLCLVCKQFNLIATPLLYRTLTISSHPFAPSQSSKFAKSLHSTLDKNPLLRPLCRNLVVQICDKAHQENPLEHWLIGDVVSWLDVKRLDISGGFTASSQIWGVVKRATQGMRRVEDIRLKGGPAGLLLAPIFRTLVGFPSLKKVSLSSISKQPRDPPIWPSETIDGKAGFSSLTLCYFEEALSGISSLIRWTSNLEHFTFLRVVFNAESTTLRVFLDILQPHCKSLKTLRIGVLPNIFLRNGDLSEFTSLESLHVSSRNIHSTPEYTAAFLATSPCLKTFRFDFLVSQPWNDSWGPEPIQSWDDNSSFEANAPTRPSIVWRGILGPREGQWLRKLGELVRCKAPSLKELKIVFMPIGSRSLFNFDEVNEHKYPWTFVNEFTEKTADGKLILVYDRPQMTVEDHHSYCMRLAAVL